MPPQAHGQAQGQAQGQMSLRQQMQAQHAGAQPQLHQPPVQGQQQNPHYMPQHPHAAQGHVQGQMPPQLAGQTPGQLMGQQPQAAMAQLQQQAQMIAGPESKSMIGKLLKRAPKGPNIEMPQMIDANPMLAAAAAPAAAAASSGSLFNKNFLLGAVVGLVVGAFGLPYILGLIGGDAEQPIQAQAQSPAQATAPAIDQPLPGFDPNAPAPEPGETFLDAAIDTNEP